MFFAWNERTNEKVKSMFVFQDGSYQLPKEDKWYAPKSEITNWEELKQKGIEKVYVNYVIEARYKNYNNTPIVKRPFFRIENKEKLGIKTRPENKWHKIAETWIYNIIKNKDLKLIYSTINKPNNYNNNLNLTDLPIDYKNQETEVIIKGGGVKRIADVMCPFLITHPLFGNGIIFEIQFSKQKPKLEERRTIDRTFQGYSVVWLHESDFDKIGEEHIHLKKNEVTVLTFASELKRHLPKYTKNLIYTVQDLCGKLAKKKNEILQECNDKIDELEDNSYNSLLKIQERILELHKKYIDNFPNKIKRDISNSISIDFLKNNQNYFDSVINEKVSEWINKIKQEYFIKEIQKSEIDEYFIIERIIDDLKEEMRPFYIYKELKKEPCPTCEEIMQIKNGSYGCFWGCPNYKICGQKPISIPSKLAEKLRGIF